MSITGSMFVASGALDAFGNSISVAGDNIANLNTVGFKASRFHFADLLPTVVGDIESGHGVRLADVSKPFQQGAFEITTSITDLAIAGNGFFTVRDALTGASYYTRAGQFHLDAAGRLVNSAGMVLQGLSGDVALGNAPMVPAQATSSLALQFTLDAGAVTPTAPFPPGPDASPSTWISASNFSSVTTIYDALGNAHDLTFLFRQIAPNTWEYRVVAPRGELDASASNSTDLREVAAPGTLVFNSIGQLDPVVSTITDITGLNWTAGGSQTISAGSLSFAGTVQFDQPSSLFAAVQDGFSQGALTGITIDGQGVISGRYSNGTNLALATLPLANFANVEGLAPVGDTLFLATLESGAAQTGVPGQAGLGSIIAAALELSTVDLAREFVSLISSQRAFQVNSRIITTADRMYSIAAELKS